MRMIRTIAAAFSMFSAIPMPLRKSGDGDMRYFLCAFPLVGIVVGLFCGLAAYLCLIFGLPDMLRGALLTLIPVIITGGIHLDGYADTCDALSSFGDVGKKHEILKDPHIGTFAVINLCTYFILTFSLWCVLPEYPYLNVVLMYTVSRTLSGLSVASFPMYEGGGLAHMFSEKADKKRVKGILIFFDFAIIALFITQGYQGIIMAATAHIVFAFYHHVCRRKFEGLSGDLCGWFVCSSELWMLIAAAISEFICGRMA